MIGRDKNLILCQAGLTPAQIKEAQNLMAQVLKDSSGQTINIEKTVQDILAKTKSKK